MTAIPRFLISAAHKSSGKTTVSIGLCGALSARGLKVQAFKKGPDYIDPLWLHKASGNPCYNLDFYTMDPDEIEDLFLKHGAQADISLIEGNKGLYDGLDIAGSNSNAALATLLKTPVVLVLDAQGMTRGIAPLILGYIAFDKNIQIAGVILNKLGGSRHEGKLRAVIQHYTDVPVLGAIHRQEALHIDERHLGLIPSNETAQSLRYIKTISSIVSESVDLDALLAIANQATAINKISPVTTPQSHALPVRIAIARDEAFGFYYADDLEAFAQQGATLININTLTDQQLPEVDGLFIGGGFPETNMAALEKNASLRRDIQAKIEQGLPTYAECGGLMYLCRSLEWNGQQHQLVGVIPADVKMHAKPIGRGYISLEDRGNHPWDRDTQKTGCQRFNAHEFHYSSLENLPDSLQTAYTVKRGFGIDGQSDGILYKNLVANYSHFRNLRSNPWVERFVQFVRRHKTTSFSS